MKKRRGLAKPRRASGRREMNGAVARERLPFADEPIRPALKPG